MLSPAREVDEAIDVDKGIRIDDAHVAVVLGHDSGGARLHGAL